MKNQAIVTLTFEAIEHLFAMLSSGKPLLMRGLPADAHLINLGVDDRCATLRIKYQHDSFPLTAPGEELMNLDVSIEPFGITPDTPEIRE